MAEVDAFMADNVRERRAGEMLHINVRVSRPSPRTSRPNWLAPPLLRCRYSGPSTPLPRSRPLSPTEQGECDAKSEHDFRGYAPHACGPTGRGHRAPAAHA